jgi:hypothetical protein
MTVKRARGRTSGKFNLRESIINFFKDLTPRGYFVIWLCGLLLIAFLLWQLSGTARSAMEINLANKILENAGGKNKISSALKGWFLPGRATQAGTWYLLQDDNIALIFTVPVDGLFVPFLATFNTVNEIEAIYPLSKTAEYTVLPEKNNSGILDMWMLRITDAAKIINNARQ